MAICLLMPKDITMTTPSVVIALLVDRSTCVSKLHRDRTTRMIACSALDQSALFSMLKHSCMRARYYAVIRTIRGWEHCSVASSVLNATFNFSCAIRWSLLRLFQYLYLLLSLFSSSLPPSSPFLLFFLQNVKTIDESWIRQSICFFHKK